jgi:hypothetical protein
MAKGDEEVQGERGLIKERGGGGGTAAGSREIEQREGGRKRVDTQGRKMLRKVLFL